jgi:hypothetical protein
LYKYHCEMKLIGVIAVLVLIATGCQKEQVRPNNPATAPVLRAADAPSTAADDENPGTLDNTGGGITDPNDANRTNKNPKPRQ